MIPDAGRARAGLFSAFAGLGVTAALVPAVLPAAERSIDADLSSAVPALFAGLLIGVIASGPLLMRRPPQIALILGGALQAAAIVGVALAATPAVFIAAAVVAGFGFGLVEASGSVAAKSVAVGSATGLLSALLGTVAVCAAVTPLVVALGSGVRPALGILAVVPLVSVAVFSVAMFSHPTPSDPTPTAAYTEAPSRRDTRGLLVLLPFAVALPLYVGVETVLSGWSAVIPGRILAIDPGVAALGTSAFWSLMALGRFGAATLRRLAVPPTRILATATCAAAVLMAAAGLLVDRAPVWALVALAAVVVLLAPSYGLILGLALDRLDPARSAAATGALVACGAVGGAAIPALILMIGRDPASGTTFLVAAALCALVPLLVLVAARPPRPATVPR
ncbi:MFS transporter [Microbacterium sp. NPDC028030]|uniref:MFS transporter n=1 Tax=Microbacterium sp. NPDC028030 TaxID=3155124 RepID=UPI0033F59D9D